MNRTFLVDVSMDSPDALALAQEIHDVLDQHLSEEVLSVKPWKSPLDTIVLPGVVPPPEPPTL